MIVCSNDCAEKVWDNYKRNVLDVVEEQMPLDFENYWR